MLGEDAIVEHGDAESQEITMHHARSRETDEPMSSPAFSEGKSECRVRVFLESGFCTGPSPVRVSQYVYISESVRNLHVFNNNVAVPDVLEAIFFSI